MEIIEIHLDVVDSTNSYAKNHGEIFAPNQITCVTAEEQTAGRGRYQRKWASPRGVNLYTTFCFQLPANTPQLASLGQLMTYSFASLLLQEHLQPKIKWPNDVQLNHKKVAGVLCETVFHSNKVNIILGIGINVNMGSEDLEAIDQPATSLKNETDRTWDKKALLKKLGKQFSLDLERFKKEGFKSFHGFFEALLAYKGEKVRCFDGKAVWEGICHSLTQDGQLNLLLPDNKIHTISSGDIKH